jgi:hypothetical protein
MLPTWLAGFQGVIIICIFFCIVNSLVTLAFNASCFQNKDGESFIACAQKKRLEPGPIIANSLLGMSCCVLVILAIASSPK